MTADFDPRSRMRSSVRHLKPYYRAPRERLLRLDQNTNLHGRNPAIDRMEPATLEFNQYPTRDADDLLVALEHTHDLSEGSVLAGNGSDEVLDIILKAFTDPGDHLVTPGTSYSLYPFYAALNDLKHVQVPLTDDWDIDLDGILQANGQVTLVAAPNNPTGRAVDRDRLERLIEEANGIVVIDEAYVEYTDQNSVIDLTGDHRNLVVMRTFSKAYALAGARLGWMAAHPDTIQVLGLVKPPFNVNVMTEALGLAALEEAGWMQEAVDEVREERPRLTAALVERGFEVIPSDANFLLTFPPVDGPSGPDMAELLHREGIATRTFPQAPRLEHSIRFTIGRRVDNDHLLAHLDGILEAEQ